MSVEFIQLYILGPLALFASSIALIGAVSKYMLKQARNEFSYRDHLNAHIVRIASAEQMGESLLLGELPMKPYYSGKYTYRRTHD